MREQGKDFFIQILSICVLLLIFPNLYANTKYKEVVGSPKNIALTPTPTPFEPFPYKIPKIQKDRSYRIMLVGDSMVGSLGPNAQLLRQHLIELYPTHEFVNYNYGFGSTSIETLPERLTKETEYDGQKFPAILSQGFDMIIVGSFAYNPLSQYPVNEGVAEQIRVMDESVREIIRSKPDSVVAILVPIAPSKSHFAQGVYDLPPAERVAWANERTAYIKAVIDYANAENIPLINVYERSLDASGEANLIYINTDDHIHPSVEGVDLMSRTIADFIYSNSIFPE